MITQKRLKEVIHYNPGTGVFTWRIQANSTTVAGKRAGTIWRSKGRKKQQQYRQISVDGKIYREHQLAFLYMKGSFPGKHVDHKNLDSLDNRWLNLRAATNGQNLANTEVWASNTSGAKGVSWVKAKRKWRASINWEKRYLFLGYFDNLEEAARAYRDKADELHGDFARTG